MSSEVLNVVLQRELPVVPYSLTAENQKEFSYHSKVSNQPITLLRPSQRASEIEKILQDYPRLIAVDYTHPDAVNSNALFYQKYGIPFVMGTTGGDPPNMGKQIVALQTMLNKMAQSFPGVFQNYRLQVTESHQQTKADTSGTAKEMINPL
ncbi:4-hydroxy-tetrahydrodipicolinate reductase 1, chloroplastic [Galdieria sulphuraria]|nr:4-hydroxy-tetrahydrodipicolinate reductase 1, chloroplastic [Galdieria sulphuraria]